MSALLSLLVLAAAPAGTETDAAVRAIEAHIASTYVVTELRAPLVARLEQGRKTGRYETANPDQFVNRINEDLDAVAHDGHLYLRNDPSLFTAMSAPEDAAAVEAYRKAQAARSNSGLTRLDILPGNIRYLKITGFQWVPGVTAQAYDDAARFLIDGDAVIIDLRDNGGGHSEAADYFAKVLLAPDPWRPATAAARERNLRWAGKPTYMLVNGGVGSAAEAVAYGAQQEKVATIVGATTYGAANNNKKFAIAPRYVLSVSYNRPMNPISGTNWEGKGVQPDIVVPGHQALAAAEVAALDRLAARQGVPPEQLADIRWARTAAAAELNPVTLAQGTDQALAGDFGSISIKATPAGLRFYRADRPKRPQGVLMVPLDDKGLFGIPGYDDLRARITTADIVLMHGAEDQRESFPRTQPAPAAD